MFLAGLLVAWICFEAQPDLPLRASFGWLTSNLWLAIPLFYGIPLLLACQVGFLTLRLTDGIWLVAGSWVAYTWGTLLYLDDYIYVGRAFGHCGNGVRAWLATSCLLPSALGKALVLLHACRDVSRRKRQSLTSVGKIF